jgi:hypothetical protein
VTIFYLSNVGLCSPEFTTQFYRKYLTLVADHSEEAEICRRWRKGAVQPFGSGHLRVSLDGSTGKREEESSPPERNEATLDPGCSHIAEPTETARRHDGKGSLNISEFSLTGVDPGENLVGVLPDGRNLYWFQCDPKCLYSSSSCYYGANPMYRQQLHEIEQAFHADVVANGSYGKRRLIAPPLDSHCCLWGCVRKQDDAFVHVSHTSMESIIQHLREHHSLGDAQPESPPLVGCTRISEGEAIRRLSHHIALAACTIDPSLLHFTKKIGMATARSPLQQTDFMPPDLIYFDPDSNGPSGLKSMTEIRPTRSSTALLLYAVGRRIGNLFDSDGMGKQPLLGSVEGPFISSAEQSSFQLRHEPCDSCVVCNMLSEPLVPGKNGSFEGLGCASASTVCFGVTQKCDVRLAQSKKLLISIAERLPKALYSESSPPPGIHGDVSTQLWKDDCFDTWRSFVVGCTFWRSVAQAFAVLVGSLDRTRLPAWWMSEGSGWSQVKAVLASRSLSGLMHQLYVFDAAMTESASAAMTDEAMLSTCNQGIPRKFDGLQFDEIVKTVLDWAKKMRFEKLDQENLIYCCVCQDGGNLLCCELCRNVQHKRCVQVPTPLEADPEMFVCHCCIVDMAAMTKAVERSVATPSL